VFKLFEGDSYDYILNNSYLNNSLKDPRLFLGFKIVLSSSVYFLARRNPAIFLPAIMQPLLMLLASIIANYN